MNKINQSSIVMQCNPGHLTSVIAIFQIVLCRLALSREERTSPATATCAYPYIAVVPAHLSVQNRRKCIAQTSSSSPRTQIARLSLQHLKYWGARHIAYGGLPCWNSALKRLEAPPAITAEGAPRRSQRRVIGQARARPPTPPVGRTAVGAR